MYGSFSDKMDKNHCNKAGFIIAALMIIFVLYFVTSYNCNSFHLQFLSRSSADCCKCQSNVNCATCALHDKISYGDFEQNSIRVVMGDNHNVIMPSERVRASWTRKNLGFTKIF